MSDDVPSHTAEHGASQARASSGAHDDPVFAFHHVLSGIGVSVDADGVETAIGPGGYVLSPAGPGGAHGYRNVGDMPLQMLVVFPSADGSRPGRTVVETTS